MHCVAGNCCGFGKILFGGFIRSCNKVGGGKFGGKVVLSLVVVKKQQLPVFFWEVWKGIGCKNISQFLLVKTFPLSFHPGFPNLLTNGPQFLPGEINSSTKSFPLVNPSRIPIGWNFVHVKHVKNRGPLWL